MSRSICLYCFVTKIVVYESDGAPLQRERARQLRLHVTKYKVAGKTSTEEEKALIIPDDSVVKYSVPTDENDKMITVRVSTFFCGAQILIPFTFTRQFGLVDRALAGHAKSLGFNSWMGKYFILLTLLLVTTSCLKITKTLNSSK